MGLFFPSDPIVHGQRAKGLPRYQELLERDWKSFLFADFVTLGLCIPYGLGVGYHRPREAGRGCFLPAYWCCSRSAFWAGFWSARRSPA